MIAKCEFDLRLANSTIINKINEYYKRNEMPIISSLNDFTEDQLIDILFDANIIYDYITCYLSDNDIIVNNINV